MEEKAGFSAGIVSTENVWEVKTMNPQKRHVIMPPLRLALSLMMIAALAAVVTAATSAQAVSDPFLHDMHAPMPSPSSPVMFIENVGQWDERAAFQVWGGPGDAMWIGRDGSIWLTVLEDAETMPSEQGLHPPERDVPARPLRGVHIKLTFENANPRARIEPFAPQDTVVSYFYGNDPKGWRPHVPVWGGVRYRDLYPGVDLILTGEKGRGFVWRMACQGPCGQALGQVRLRVEGAESLSLDEVGALILHTAVGDLRLPLLLTPASAAAPSPRLEDATIVAPFSVSPAPLRARDALGPGLIYSTFLGGSDTDRIRDLALDDQNRVYVTGSTYSRDFPIMPGAFQGSYNNKWDLFVAKLAARGDQLLYATFVSGWEDDVGKSIAVDAQGRAYVAGYTESEDFPVTPNAYDRTLSGYSDAVVLKLSALGDALFYATYLGGQSREEGIGIAVGTNGHAYVVGVTKSDDFPLLNPYQSSRRGNEDIFVTKLTPSGSGLVYSTFLGGSLDDEPFSMALGGNETVYITGWTRSQDFPTTGLYRNHHGIFDAFVTALAPSGRELAFSTYLGGESNENGKGIAVSDSGVVYVTGYTTSSDFPRRGNASRLSGGQDAFLAILWPPENSLLYATFWGGSGFETGEDLALGPDGSIYLVGDTTSSDFFVTDNALNPSYRGRGDFFISRFLPNGIVKYSSYLGGQDGEAIYISATVNEEGDLFVAGETESSDFPTTDNAFDTTYHGLEEAFIARLDIIPPELENVRASHDAIYRIGCNLDPASTTIRADVRDARLHKVELYYRTPLDFFNWHHKDMVHETGSTYQASLTGFLALPISYYVKATDSLGQTAVSSTRTITVQDCSQLYMPVILK